MATHEAALEEQQADAKNRARATSLAAEIRLAQAAADEAGRGGDSQIVAALIQSMALQRVHDVVQAMRVDLYKSLQALQKK